MPPVLLGSWYTARYGFGVESTAFDIGLYGLVVALGFLFAMPFAETALDGAASGDLHHAGGAVGRRPSDWLCRTLGASPVRAVKIVRREAASSAVFFENLGKCLEIFRKKFPISFRFCRFLRYFFLSF